MTQYMRRQQETTPPTTRTQRGAATEKIYPPHQRPRKVTQQVRALPKLLGVYGYSLYAKRYVADGLLRSKVQSWHESHWCEAESMDEAEAIANDHVFELCPESEGWESHSIDVIELPEEMVRKIVNNRLRIYDQYQQSQGYDEEG